MTRKRFVKLMILGAVLAMLGAVLIGTFAGLAEAKEGICPAHGGQFDSVNAAHRSTAWILVAKITGLRITLNGHPSYTTRALCEAARTATGMVSEYGCQEVPE